MKTVFISGASGGIGLGIVEKFLNQDYFVIAQANKNVKAVYDLAKKLNKEDYLYVFTADFTNIEQTISMLSNVKNSFNLRYEQ